MTEKGVGIDRRRAEVDVDEAPLTRAILDAHPDMWPRISSFVPAGWDREIADALEAIMALAGETGVEIRVAQIKSKLAGLRLYLDIDEESAGPIEFVDSTPISTRLRSSSKQGSVRERATAIVDAAAGRCETRCELCGAPGAFRNESGWLRIACSVHARPTEGLLAGSGYPSAGVPDHLPRMVDPQPKPVLGTSADPQEQRVTRGPIRTTKSVANAPPQLRVQVASDLHLEFIQRRFPKERVIKLRPDADLLVLAGDVTNGLGILDAFGDWPVPILYVIGNHESYGRVYDQDRKTLRAACAGTNVVLLDQDVVTSSDLAVRFPAWASSRAPTLPDVRFVGCTLWTGYRYTGCGKSHEAQMDVSERGLNDHRLIRLTTGPFDVQAALACHEADCAWLRGELVKPFDGDTFVVTHHAPSERSVHPRFQGDPLTGAFVTDLPDLLEQAQIWIHGHHHDSSDYVERGCRVVCNPSGYPMGLNSIRDAEEMHFENTRFDGHLMIELPTEKFAAR